MEPNILEIYYRDREAANKVTQEILTRLDNHDHAISSFNKTNEDMQEVLGYFLAAKGGFTVLTWVGKLCKILWAPAALGIAIYVYVHTGRWEMKL